MEGKSRTDNEVDPFIEEESQVDSEVDPFLNMAEELRRTNQLISDIMNGEISHRTQQGLNNEEWGTGPVQNKWVEYWKDFDEEIAKKLKELNMNEEEYKSELDKAKEAAVIVIENLNFLEGPIRLQEFVEDSEYNSVVYITFSTKDGDWKCCEVDIEQEEVEWLKAGALPEWVWEAHVVE